MAEYKIDDMNDEKCMQMIDEECANYLAREDGVMQYLRRRLEEEKLWMAYRLDQPQFDPNESKMSIKSKSDKDALDEVLANYEHDPVREAKLNSVEAKNKRDGVRELVGRDPEFKIALHKYQAVTRLQTAARHRRFDECKNIVKNERPTFEAVRGGFFQRILTFFGIVKTGSVKLANNVEGLFHAHQQHKEVHGPHKEVDEFEEKIQAAREREKKENPFPDVR